MSRPRLRRGDRNAVRLACGFMACGALLGAAALTSPDADATPLTFVQKLNNAGITVYDATSAISSGYRICDALNYGDGEQVAYQVFTHSTWADVPDMATARVWVVASVEALCPNHDHRGEAAVA